MEKDGKRRSDDERGKKNDWRTAREKIFPQVFSLSSRSSGLCPN